MNYVPNLGELCGDDARRDAIHIACAPVIAFHDLMPGDHVTLDSDMQAHVSISGDRSSDTVGIVDPFLSASVKEGEKFWLFLYPGSITGLRHVWCHPAFLPKALVG